MGFISKFRMEKLTRINEQGRDYNLSFELPINALICLHMPSPYFTCFNVRRPIEPSTLKRATCKTKEDCDYFSEKIKNFAKPHLAHD